MVDLGWAWKVTLIESVGGKTPSNCLSAFFWKAYLIPLVIVETLENFVVISLWFVCVLANLRV